MRRRLFEGFQQRVKTMRRQHVHFVDEIDFESSLGRRVLHIVEQFAGVVDFGARRGVDFDEVDEIALVDAAAGHALAARFGTHALLAVQRLGENPRQRGLAHAARAGEQERVVHALAVEAVDQRRDHMFLADDLLENFWPPLAGQRLVTHRCLRRCCDGVATVLVAVGDGGDGCCDGVGCGRRRWRRLESILRKNAARRARQSKVADPADPAPAPDKLLRLLPSGPDRVHNASPPGRPAVTAMECSMAIIRLCVAACAAACRLSR